MKKTILTTLAIVSACAASATATDLDGSVSAGGSLSSIHGQKAKANEYRALGDGAAGGFDLNYRTPSSFLDVDANVSVTEGKQPTQDLATDNNFKIKGGMTDLFKLSLFYNEIPHNLTFGASTFMNGVGTNVLTSPLTPATTVPTVANTAGLWKSFDYSLFRRNFGADAEISLKTPFFFGARVDRQETSGLQPYNWTTQLRELPAPVDYTTDTLFLQTGYRSKSLIATIEGTISNFQNANNTIYIGQLGNTAATAAGYGYLPPDNRFYKVGGSIMYKLPIWSTTLMARGSHAMQESNPLLFEAPAAGLTWNGLITTDNGSVVITSSPLPKLDTRIHFNYLITKNKSDNINYSTSATATSYNQIAAKYDYNKKVGGIDLSYKLPAATKVSAGYEYGDVHRATWAADPGLTTAGAPHATKTTDHTVYMQVKNNLLDWISGKLRYEHQFRSSEYPTLGLYAATNRMGYFRGFEAAGKNMDAIKTEFEFEPMHGLSLGLQYALKLNKYTNSPLGLKDDTRHEFFADVTYSAGVAKVNVYGELETVEINGLYYSGTYGSAATATNNFFWTTKRKDLNYAFGTTVDIDIVKDQLKASAGYRYESADGSNDFTVSNASIMTTPYSNVNYLDDYIKHSLSAKLTYQMSKAVSLDLGYLYEHLRYSDDAYTGYTNIVGTNFLTGAYNNPNYDASVVYTKLTYKF